MIEDKWRALWGRAGGSEPMRYPFDRLCARYAEPHRHYHTLAHVQHCLETVDALREEAENPDAVEMALWFHDAVYDTRKKDNEERSAELAYVVLDVGGFPSDFIACVVDLIMVTTHAAPPTGADESVLIDCDLAILGASPSAFDEYERRIRREYDWVQDMAFAAARASFIENVLARPTIFATQAMRLQCEPYARANLRRSLDKLTRGIVPA